MHPAPGQSDQAGLQRECQRLLASPHFAKAARSRRLLSFLVELAGQGVPGAANEYAIGLAVFDRNAAQYSTGDDPIVRVQVGRLRSRLADFYAQDAGQGSGWRMEIPLGSYTPHLARCVPAPAPGPARLAFHGLDCIAPAAPAGVFARGLGEELRYRLHRQFAAQLALVTPGQHGADQLRQLGVGFLLEGSVREDPATIRTSLRLLDLGQGRIAWSEQTDHARDLSIRRQELLATSCCAALLDVMGRAMEATAALR